MQTVLYRSFLKYGVAAHVFEVIIECSASELNYWERYYQEKYHTTGGGGLNCVLTKTTEKAGAVSESKRERMSRSQIGNRNWLGKKHTEETKNKIRMLKTGLRYSDEINKKKGRPGRVSNMKGRCGVDNPIIKPIIQYDLNGVFVRQWISGTEASKATGFYAGNISSCCNGVLKTAYGFIWRFKSVAKDI